MNCLIILEVYTNGVANSKSLQDFQQAFCGHSGKIAQKYLKLWGYFQLVTCTFFQSDSCSMWLEWWILTCRIVSLFLYINVWRGLSDIYPLSIWGVFIFKLDMCILNCTRQWWFSKKPSQFFGHHWGLYKWPCKLGWPVEYAGNQFEISLFYLEREIMTLFLQNLSLFVPRYLTCKLGLTTGWIPQGFMDPYLLPYVLMATGPVLTIGRVGRDIVRYLLSRLLPIQYGKIVRLIVCSKKWPIFEISADKSPDISLNMK